MSESNLSAPLPQTWVFRPDASPTVSISGPRSAQFGTNGRNAGPYGGQHPGMFQPANAAHAPSRSALAGQQLNFQPKPAEISAEAAQTSAASGHSRPGARPSDSAQQSLTPPITAPVGAGDEAKAPAAPIELLLSPMLPSADVQKLQERVSQLRTVLEESQQRESFFRGQLEKVQPQLEEQQAVTSQLQLQLVELQHNNRLLGGHLQVRGWVVGSRKGREVPAWYNA